MDFLVQHSFLNPDMPSPLTLPCPAVLTTPCPTLLRCAQVIVDFLVRHGYLTPDMNGYCDVLRGLRSGDCS